MKCLSLQHVWFQLLRKPIFHGFGHGMKKCFVKVENILEVEGIKYNIAWQGILYE